MENDRTEGSDLQAALTGIALSVGANWYRTAQDTNDRLSSSQDDIDGVRRAFRDHVANGHIQRQQLPVVADLLSGIAMARTQSQTPTFVPSLSTVTRPSLIALLTTAIPGFTWPPKEGTYTQSGMVQSAGELSSLGLVFTYEEVRAFLHGLVLNASPTPAQKLQTFYSANGLINAIVGLQSNFTQPEWVQIWKNIFGAAKSVKGAPTITAAVGPFALTGQGRNEAVNLKVVATAAGVNAGTVLCTVKFGTDSTGATGFTSIPAAVTGANFQIDSISTTQYVISNRVSIAANDTVTASVIVASVDA